MWGIHRFNLDSFTLLLLFFSLQHLTKASCCASLVSILFSSAPPWDHIRGITCEPSISLHCLQNVFILNVLWIRWTALEMYTYRQTAIPSSTVRLPQQPDWYWLILTACYFHTYINFVTNLFLWMGWFLSNVLHFSVRNYAEKLNVHRPSQKSTQFFNTVGVTC